MRKLLVIMGTFLLVSCGPERAKESTSGSVKIWQDKNGYNREFRSSTCYKHTVDGNLMTYVTVLPKDSLMLDSIILSIKKQQKI